MGFIKFIKSKLFLYQILIAIGVSVALIFLVMWSLNFYTQYGLTIMVPQLEGQTEAEIKESIANTGLEYVVIDSIYKNGAKPGIIVDQIPEAGKKVKKGRKIFITINAFTREMVAMPQLVDYSLRNAQVVLETMGLTLAPIVYQKSAYDGLVLDQLVDGKPIKPGTKISKGTSVTLVVGSGRGGRLYLVPELIGLTLHDAQGTAVSAGLAIGSVVYDETVRTAADSAVAIVYQQNPEPYNGRSASQGSPINIWLTADNEAAVNAMANKP